MTDESRELLIRGAAEVGVLLTAPQILQFSVFADELKKWGRKINLTAIKGDTDIAVKHFVDSLTLLQVLGESRQLLDIGSGAGLPSIPIKIVRQELQIVSVDAVEKKVLFQRHAARLLHLDQFEAVHARGESLASTHAHRFDRVVSRALSDIPTFVNIALPLVAEGGRLVAMKGRGGREEALAAENALSEIGVRVVDILEFNLPIVGDARSLVILERLKP